MTTPASAPRLDWTTWWRACAWLAVSATGSIAIGQLFDAASVLRGCGDAFGHPLTGRLDSTECLLVENGIPVFQLPWLDLAVMGGLALIALVGVLLTMRAVRVGGGLRAAALPVPALLLICGISAWREARLIAPNSWFVHPAVITQDPAASYSYSFNTDPVYEMRTPGGLFELPTPQPWWVLALLAALVSLVVVLNARTARAAVSRT
ncbi:hypothetical protein [Actinoalloteichus hymeniacidonis]|nr:hypothetical protein [Actinoalloteichus hymeniacidonis]MBB5906704.1 hypothetical protein [Actinoalloteichus hymeniacidonis]